MIRVFDSLLPLSGKLFFLAATLLIGQANLFAQSFNVDSLLAVADTAKQDTIKIDAYRRAAISLVEKEPEEGIIYARLSVKCAEAAGDVLRRAQGSKVLGVGYDIKGDLDSCLFYLNQAAGLFASLNMKDWQSHTISDIAIAYHYRGNYELALRNNLAALQLRKEIGNKDFISKSLNNIGVLYRAKKDYKNAIRYYQESLTLKKELNDEQGMLNTYLNISSSFQNKGNYDSAYYYARVSLVLAEKIHSEEDITGSRLNIGSALLNLNRQDEAFQFLAAVESEARARNYRTVLLDVHEPLGDYYLQKKEFAKAVEYFKQGLSIAKATQREEHQMIFYKQLSKSYYNLGDYQLAFRYQDSSKQVADTLLNEENIRQINEMTQVYETAEKEKQIEKLNAEKILSAAELNRRKRERNYFILASVLFLAFAAVAYAGYSANKKKRKQLNKQNKIIEESLHDKEILLKEIHHRVKNNLQIVSSLLSLQSHYIKDEQALDAVNESRNRVQSMGLIHQNLYQEDNLTSIDVQDYITKLCDNLFQSYNIKPGRITLVKEIEQMQLDVDIVVPLGLILNELITNSLKYAFPGGREGSIKIILKESNNKLKLLVYDDGAGLPAGFSLENISSFGFRMINAFMHKMKGTLRLYSEDGTKAELEITDYKIVKA